MWAAHPMTSKASSSGTSAIIARSTPSSASTGSKIPALDHLATIVRGADTSRPDLTPQCEGLLAISYGLSANFRDDHEMLKHGLVIYDALYTWCRLQRDKEHSR